MNCVVTHPYQSTLIISDISGALYFWNVGNEVSDIFSNLNLDVFEHITCVDINRAADILVGVTNKGKLIVWSLSTREVGTACTTGLTLYVLMKSS